MKGFTHSWAVANKDKLSNERQLSGVQHVPSVKMPKIGQFTTGLRHFLAFSLRGGVKDFEIVIAWKSIRQGVLHDLLWLKKAL